MTISAKICVSKERKVRTYAEMWRISRVLLNSAKENDDIAYHLLSASLVFTAFTFEAYLNHIGPKLFESWDSLERLSPKNKLKVIAEKINYKIDFGKNPWQVLNDLFGFRNDIAHGKSINVNETITINADNVNVGIMHDWAKTKWEKYCTEKNAKQARRYVSQMVLEIHGAANIDEMIFQTGLQSQRVEVIK